MTPVARLTIESMRASDTCGPAGGTAGGKACGRACGKAPRQRGLARTWASACLAALLGTSCSGDRPDPAAEQNALAPRLHDFGTIPLGESSEHDFVLDTRSVAEDLVCVGVRADCSCARTRMLLRDSSGAEREILGLPRIESAPRAGEVLVIRVRIDTAGKEAVDLPPTQSRATVVLQHLSDPDPTHRLYVPLGLRYAIDSPVRLHPFAILDFESVPMSLPRTVMTWASSDIEGRAVKFGPASCDDERIALRLLPDGDRTRIEATFRPEPGQEPGPFRSLVRIRTDLDGGREILLAATGTVIPDIVAEPMPKISLGEFDFAVPGREQFVNVHDHDPKRSPEFLVARFVDRAGRDATDRFSVRLEPIPGDARGRRVFVKYEGGLEPPSFRGELVLAKDPEKGPFLPIEIVAFHKKRP
ncbi:MAG: hypothetical protein Fur0037_13370 [Planctomycetota bacterium]